MLGKIVFYGISAVAFLHMTLHAWQYWRLRSGRQTVWSGAEAYEFVGNFCFSMWMVVGVVTVALTHINPWWSIVWIVIGGSIGNTMLNRLVLVSGLWGYIVAGERYLLKQEEQQWKDEFERLKQLPFFHEDILFRFPSKRARQRV